MSPAPVVLIEVLLVFGTALAWGLYQLYQLRRDRRRDAQAKVPDSDPSSASLRARSSREPDSPPPPP